MDGRSESGEVLSSERGKKGLPNSTGRLAAAKHKTWSTFSEPHGRIEIVAP